MSTTGTCATPLFFRLAQSPRQIAVLPAPGLSHLGLCYARLRSPLASLAPPNCGVTQTEGQELPAIGSVTGDTREHRDRLAKFLSERSIALEYSEDIAPARGTSAGGRITLLPSQSPAEELSTLVHELAHESLIGS